MLLSRRFGRLLPRLWQRRSFCKATESKDSEAKRSQQLWDILVPERNWDFRSPFIPTMILAIAVLQYMISLKRVDVAERELEESKHLLEEKRARRAAQEAAFEEKKVS
mmetsp:Transcript_35622/g.57292  ORF Transcript_35622/g.57292 Transcript_35622/m.57292 type:complete len:108 (-) Transcript_35622:171-494(-)